VECDGALIETAIFKQPVAGPVRVGRTNLAGDRQADLRVHGGPDKAVYGYPADHYPWWKSELGRDDLAWGMFGENLTIEGLVETTVRIGDVFRIGTVELEVSQPRLPCYKLGVKFGMPSMVKLFMNSGRLGFYFRVAREGVLTAGDDVRQINAADADAPTIAELARLEAEGKKDHAVMTRAARTAALTAGWREKYARLIATPPGAP
jgi:MOSC domain-containing protein YiiM